MIDFVKEIFGPIVELLWEATEPIHQIALYIAGGLLLGALLIRVFVPVGVRFFTRLKDKNTKDQQRVKAVLLAHEGLCELYAPAKNYTRDRGEDEKFRKRAWLSPYPRAVKASYKRNRVSKTEVLEARKQVKDASRYIDIKGDDPEHYEIALQLDGRDPDTFRHMTGRLKSQLGLHSLEEKPTRDPYVITFIAHETEPRDMLAEQKTGGEFFTEHPATTPNKIPLAVKENGQPWSLSTHHTLIYGMTGSGKGSVIHGVITQLAPYVEEGRCQLWGIDPKASELRPYQESRLFTAIVYETEDAQRLIEELYRTMKTRSKNKKVDLKHAELGRSLNATKATPMIVLIVDEMLSLLSSIKSKGKAGTKTLGLLTEILAQGRSLGIYVIGATQAVDTELLGRMRQNFANAIILKQESEYYNDLFLGEGAKEKGFNSTEIPASNKANDYAYAGIGYVKEETGDPVRVRFAYSSDRDIADLCQRFIPDDEWDSRQEVLADYEGLPDITEFE